jgi:muramidase (phage lysozyme)
VENDVNVKAFLKLIRYAEHTREDDAVYYLLYGGQRTFTDTSEHPLKEPITAWGRKSTSAGAYQIIHGTWLQAKKQGVAQDFTPASQDRVALWLIRSNSALGYVLEGKVEEAITRLRLQWSSLPGASQSKMQMAEAKRLFTKYVAEYTKK